MEFWCFGACCRSGGGVTEHVYAAGLDYIDRWVKSPRALWDLFACESAGLDIKVARSAHLCSHVNLVINSAAFTRTVTSCSLVHAIVDLATVVFPPTREN